MGSRVIKKKRNPEPSTRNPKPQIVGQMIMEDVSSLINANEAADFFTRSRSVGSSSFCVKECNGSRACLVQTCRRAGPNRGRDGLRSPFERESVLDF